ncbi:MAG: 50S ribosomal protein L21 [Planctomycetes bacterium]|nr:50S ribosomal protein L21 [Planctomycetota bacterium]
MYAIIRDRGNQYKVSPGDVVQIDLLDAKGGEAITFEDVLLTSNGEGAVKVGEPRVSGAKVSATVVEPLVKGEKIDVVHFRRRKDSMSKIGHRQKYTRVKIDGIEGA